jgi:sugar phosphate isomerase/epimerase
MNIAVSTLAFMGKTAEEVISIAQEHNLAIEFSSGMPYRRDMEGLFLNAPIKRYAHNYFPAPEIPFVLNLASSNDEIRSTSIRHCIKGMELSAKVKAPFFSAHAGFCVDPKPDELGRELSRVDKIDRDLHWHLFIKSVKEILEKTTHLGIDFLIENNVLAKMNVYADGTNPLLCVEQEEIQKLIDEVNDKRLGILLDTAHLKVSAKTLQFDKDVSVGKLQPLIRCIHHSDNDGDFDNNQPLGDDYWFLKHQHLFEEILHVVEVKKLSVDRVLFNMNLLKNA